ncbi:6-pyruvoyl trahydropterin synthase family protein [Sorangium atrum]|uniref:6-carboxy-5,6,7,8-tetrahydropterin synthase n=1 Tax=Sorangium atrum TaxID=2995308 RepID=A0ABT5BUR6_9BACT|nr:6-carboxytetrahydropterin synthase [Sorangium aterium]MDC0677899.1 6-carboxytetrahydropterin synthase [Sorangium aterium]
MFLLGVSDHVMIAHSFSDPFFGPATRMHGATYSVEIEIRAKALGPHHVVMDIGALHASLRRVLDTIDYTNLDEHPAFPGRTSTTERVAEHVAGLLAEEIARLPADEAPCSGATLRVLVRESPTAYAGFERDL